MRIAAIAFILSLLAAVGLHAQTAPAAAPAPQGVLVELKTRTAAFVFGDRGDIIGIRSLASQRDYLAANQPAPLLQLRVDGKLLSPVSASGDPVKHLLTLNYAGGIKAVVKIAKKPTHLMLELVEVTPMEKVELVVWGPYPTVIGDLIGEVVGVVRDPEFAVGIQALNSKTMGGFPVNENDIEPDGAPGDDPGNYPGLPAELRKQQGWRGDTARRTPFGSTLQAYCRNRVQERIVSNWGHPKFVVPPFNDGGVIGSKIALLACPAPEALQTLGEIEVAEGLPHPMLDGIWTKQAPGATASYLIIDFGESSIDQAIEMTQRAGLKYLYHSSPFDTWGHFKLNPKLFPHGWDGFRDCVAKARKAGIGVGFHTLSNFISTDDAYVTPKPDPRLAQVGASKLTVDVDVAATELPVADPSWFRKQTDLNTVAVGNELIQYEAVSAAEPWRLLKCRRGAFGTAAAAHLKDAPVGKLMDHGYKVFLTNAELSLEVARNIADFCNHTGTIQLSLDGLEGNWSTGMGQYGRTLFTQAWHDALSPELRGKMINDASNPGHFTWHIATRYNWGEPWYAGFRQSQTIYRLKNQLFYTRNLLPRMLGWFSLRGETSVEDAEWLCARAAGYDAGFALATSFDSKATQAAGGVTGMDPRKAAILVAIQQWETARQAGAFPDSLKPALQDVEREFHLAPIGPGEWEIQPVKPAGPAIRIKAKQEGLRG